MGGSSPMGILSRLLASVPSGFEVEICKHSGLEASFLSCGRDLLACGASEPFAAKGLVRYLALRRLRNWWNIPAFGSSLEDLPQETQFLIWERKDGSHCLLLPLVDGDIRAVLKGVPGGMALSWEGQLPGDEPEKATLAVVASGSDPFALVQGVMELLSKRLKSFRLRRDKRVPEFASYFGWCTWDAFYHDVDASKVEAGLSSFAKGGVKPGFVVLDDGWQDADRSSMTLQSFGADEAKFPGGLAPLIEKAKSKYGVKIFGVWHAFEGYWQGVDPKGPLGFRYDIIPNQKTDPPPAGESAGKTYRLKLLDPKDASRFYNDYHRALRCEGVDMVKVDNQSSLEDFTKGECGRVSSMRLYQEALQGSSQSFFLGNCIHCMSNGSDVIFNMMSANAYRNSDDYYPKRGPDAQQTHLLANAMNALWSSTFAIPDWDMFQSHGPCPELHAAARAISGGPVYVCDKPGMQDFSIISKLLVSGSKVLAFDAPAQPCASSIYVDARIEPAPLKIWNRKGSLGVLGLFNCLHKGASLAASFKASDIPGLEGKSFAVYLHSAGSLSLLGSGSAAKIELPAAGWEIATLSPLDSGVAPLGLLDKYAGAAAVLSSGWLEKGVYRCELTDGGRAGFYSKRKPSQTLCSGRKAKFSYDAKSGLLSLQAPTGAKLEITIHFGKNK